MTAEEIREQIKDVVMKNGGHLASSLGAVELAMALAETFDPQTDRVVWDVGHQAYAWKILTGRAETFASLRTFGGISPFPNPQESRADAAVAGHAGSAFSVAAGFAAARDLRGSGEHVVAVIGDASIANGHSFEALNNLAAATKKLIVVLNDNDMSISRPSGSFARFLGRLTSGVRYNRAKNATKAVGRALRLGFLYRPVHVFKHFFKRMFLGDVYFEQFGLHYLGPVDGHDLVALTSALKAAKDEPRSVLVHVVTRKGKGFGPAEKDPTSYHGVSPAAVKRPEGRVSWSSAFGTALCELARSDARIVALTAGMKDGTGLAGFAAEFPNRFYDVGIAEGHMVAFAGGMAGGGLRPVVAVYSTFLQRAVDQVMHDVAIANLPVVICVDRAGVVGADGVTHQGVFDLAMLRCLPNLTICQPQNAADLKALLQEALKRNGPTVIRYPRGTCPADDGAALPGATVADHARVALWTTGDWYGKACEVARRVGGCEVVVARYLKPHDDARLQAQRSSGLAIVSLENGSVCGGLGEALGADLKLGWPDVFIPHGSPAELEKAYGLDVDALVSRIGDFLKVRSPGD